jgi:hypothetical protein
MIVRTVALQPIGSACTCEPFLCQGQAIPQPDSGPGRAPYIPARNILDMMAANIRQASASRFHCDGEDELCRLNPWRHF